MQLVDLVLYKVYAELKHEITAAYLGVFWWVLEPLFYLGAFYLIFALGVRVGGDDYISFLLCGLIAWKWFASAVGQGSNSLIAHRWLMQQIYLPKYVLSLISPIVNAVKFAVTMVMVMAFLVWRGKEPSLAWLYLPLVIAVEFLLVTGATMLTAAIVPFAQDLRFLIANGLTLLMFLSGIFYDVRSFDVGVQRLFYLNPMVSVIDAYRDILIAGTAPGLVALAAVTAFSLLMLLLSLVIFRRFDTYYPKVMM